MNWKDELKKNVCSLKDLNVFFPELDVNNEAYQEVLSRYPMSITQYYLSLIDKANPHDPIRKMCIPSFGEMELTGDQDTSGEFDNTVLAGLQHKYPQTALILSTNRCAMYCRHCFRKRMVGLSEQELAQNFEGIMTYIEQHEEITNVLVSGGDAFLNDNRTIENYLDRLSQIDHLDLIRFGTRLPVVFPQRIFGDEEFLQILNKYGRQKQIYVVTQFNHPKEMTPEALQGIQAMQKAGVILRNQTVLLKGINDSSEVLGSLLRRLTSAGILPYYVFQCRPVTGVKNQFQVPLEQGYDIVAKAKQLQNGQGKSFRYILSNRKGKIEILGKLQNGEMLFQFHQAKNPEDTGRIFHQTLPEGTCWVE